jgi:acetoin utilization protein AcuB
MLVDQVMTREVVTVTEDAPVGRAWKLLQEGRFRHLPVVAGDELVGMVSDRDLQLAIARVDGETAAAGTVGAIMWRGVATTTPETPVEEASRLMLEYKIGALPVMEDERLVGIVTESDLFRMLTGMLGTGEPSTRLQFDMVSPTRELAEVTRIARDLDIPIVSLVTAPGGGWGKRTVALRIGTIAPGPFLRRLEAAGIRPSQPLAVAAAG